MQHSCAVKQYDELAAMRQVQVVITVVFSGVVVNKNELMSGS
jgi:hypothetical protein